MTTILRRFRAWLGSLLMAVTLLITIGAVLAWGTIYEAKFGTAAVQRTVYQAWWFQALLAFLAVNLTIAALERWPWQRRHAPFLLAHLGIILILIGGILGGRFGIEGQLILPEGEADRALRTPQKVIRLTEPGQAGRDVSLPTQFEASAWVERPSLSFDAALGDMPVRLRVDRYLPDAAVEERVLPDGPSENPAVQVRVTHEERSAELWLFARDPERFGAGVEQAHVLFLEPGSEELAQLLGEALPPDAHPLGSVRVTLPGGGGVRELPVPPRLPQTVELAGTPYRVTFRERFDDLAITDQGIVNRSPEPRNPAIALTLAGPAGADAHLLFALHPEFQAVHGFEPKNPVQLRYVRAADAQLPPRSIGILRLPSGGLAAALTDAGGSLTRINPLEVGARHEPLGLGYAFEVRQFFPRATLVQDVTPRGRDVRAEAVHVTLTSGAEQASGWLFLGEPLDLRLGGRLLRLVYGSALRELPFAVKLLDFRRVDYPGTQMAASFESDVELTDPARGLLLIRTIRMNRPLKYRGYHLYQASFIEGPVETTVLAVRNDPGTPFVYAGFLIVLAGVIGMFILRRDTVPASSETPRPALELVESVR